MCIDKIKKMIHIGVSKITELFMGSTENPNIYVGDYHTYPEGQVQVYLNLSPTTVQPWNGYYRTGTITVDTNASSWSVVAESTPSGNYFTAVKTNDATITWTMQENSGITSRVGFVTVTAGSVTAQTTVYQNAGYYIYIDNTSPAVVNSGATTLAVSVWSRYGNTAVPVSYQITGSDWVRYTSMNDAGSGHYIYNFAIDANTDTQARYNGITFTQTQGSSSPYKSASIGITQQAKHVPVEISGFTEYASYGEWKVGTICTGTGTTVPSGSTYYSNGIVVVKETPVTKDSLVEMNLLAWQWMAPVTGATPQSYSETGVSFTVASGSTLTLTPYGFDESITYYGAWVKSPSQNALSPRPNMQINQITGFKVTPTTT